MTCPHRDFNTSTNNWYCRITLLHCPEVTLEGFDYKFCSTYEEEKKNQVYKKFEEILDRNKAVLDRLGKKETTHEDWEKFIKLIEENHCKNCKYQKELEEVEGK